MNDWLITVPFCAVDVLALKGNKFSQRDFREFPGSEEYVARRKARYVETERMTRAEHDRLRVCDRRCDKALNATVEFGRDLF